MRGEETEGLFNTALLHSSSVPVCPSSLTPPPHSPLYLDKKCEVVRFHSASPAHKQDDHMLVHIFLTHTNMFGPAHICKHFYRSRPSIYQPTDFFNTLFYHGQPVSLTLPLLRPYSY